ncbi:precorrin-2 dehydrogenase/sirohydrochlorin ferrochelatase family protein [Paenibacillus dakarensis]|uniref:precorrin-2 dehydrogenase/sirohydrochlorin ferrochelatase family protein n=1 Tax=Paenibacillus dakarensis TaxID=1527293 RepID=UPI0006D57F79|nr:bifunctional precorrin-2 dehydrogenase/sirohydrochlorin ferrochelatase [Paenibacillus dakarensis]
MAHFVPVMLNCEGQKCLVIGGGKVAERKIRALLDAGALVHIISPDLSEWLHQLSGSGQVQWICRPYEPGDIKGAFLVHAATNDPEVNEMVALEARKLGVLVNVSSSGESGTFMNPAVIRRGRMTVAVSTSGAGPLAAKRICRRLEEQLGDEMEEYLEFLYTLRSAVKEQIESGSERRKILRKIYEVDILQDIERGSFTPWTSEQIQLWISHNREE